MGVLQYIIKYVPLLFNYQKKWIVYRLECQFRKKLNIKCREFQLILQMIAMEINLTVTMTYLQNSDHHSLFVE